MNKIDYRKEMRNLYSASAKEPSVVDVPELSFLMIDGKGDPNISQQYKEAVETLFAVSYTLKFIVKEGKSAVDYAVMPLEGLWWVDNIAEFSMENKNAFNWTSMIMQPKFVTKTLLKEALEQVTKKKQLPALPKLRFESFNEGLSAQIMHIGPYATEKPTIDRLRNFISIGGYISNGKHHEIYLSTPGKTAPEKLKIIIRQPIRENKHS